MSGQGTHPSRVFRIRRHWSYVSKRTFRHGCFVSFHLALRGSPGHVPPRGDSEALAPEDASAPTLLCKAVWTKAS